MRHATLIAGSGRTGTFSPAREGITAAPDRPVHRVAFFLDEFGQLGRMDRLADSVTSGTGEDLQGRPLLTLDEVMRLGTTRPIVLVAGEPPYLLDRISYSE